MTNDKYKMVQDLADAEVVSLTNQRDYEYVRAENAEQERDQLREQVTRMRDALESMSALGVMAVYNGSPHWIFPIKVMHRSNEALAATKPKP